MTAIAGRDAYKKAKQENDDSMGTCTFGIEH